MTTTHQTLHLIPGGEILCGDCCRRPAAAPISLRPLTEAEEATIWANTGEIPHCSDCGAALPTDLEKEEAPGYDRSPAALLLSEDSLTEPELNSLVVDLLRDLPISIAGGVLSEGGSTEEATAAIRSAMLRIARVVARESAGTTLGDVIAAHEYDLFRTADSKFGG